MAMIFLNLFFYSNLSKFWKTFFFLIVFVSCLLFNVTGDNCFGGIATFEKLAMTDFDNTFNPTGTLLEQPDQALTRDCINLCKQQPGCVSFSLEYTQFRCVAYSTNSIGRRNNLISTNTTNFFEKVCYRGVPREDYQKVCGVERLWAFERVKGAFLEGYAETVLNNIGSKDECAKACLMEISFTCRSADYDHEERICRLSKEDRRTQPQAFRLSFDSNKDYLENQCAAPGSTTCLYDTKKNVGVITMDSLVFAHDVEDCEAKCDKEYTFNCRAYSIESKRCFLSGDDSISLSNPTLPFKFGSFYGEKKCVTELCTHGIFTYEKVTGHILRSALSHTISFPHTASFGIIEKCRTECDKSNLNCPAFTVNYRNGQCDKLDRNSQGRGHDFVSRDGESYFEKVCLRGPEIMSMCQDKFWAFERVIGYELTPLLYERIYHFVQSRRYCEEYCLQEKLFTCRSALYNDDTTECKLSREDRRTKPVNYILNSNPKINYLENQCIRSHSVCPYESTSNAHPTFTDIVISEGINSSEDCKKRCNDHEKFICRSYSYYQGSNECFISGDDSVSSGATHITRRSGMTYYERKCKNVPASDDFISESEENNQDSRDDHFTERQGKSTTDQAVVLPNDVTFSNGLGSSITNKVSRKPSSESPISFTPSGEDEQQPSKNDTEYNDDTVVNINGSYTSVYHNYSSEPPKKTRPSIDSSNEIHTSLVSSSSEKCEAGFKFVFERIPNFEPIGGYLNVLHHDKSSPGIVIECAKKCEIHSSCFAFVMDYNYRSCYGMFGNQSLGRLDMRLSVGKDYFEGFCVPSHLACSKAWQFDRIIDQASINVQPKSVSRYIERVECEKRCLEAKRFKCLSASYDSTLKECRLYDQDRNSGALRLLFTKGTDYIENQCGIDTSGCRYLPIERDIATATITKSIRGHSTFVCEQECNREKDFTCRSYTYIDQTSIPGGNFCLLSSDNRGKSQKGAIVYRPRALYAEKDCRINRRGRVSSTADPRQTNANLLITSISSTTIPAVSVRKCDVFDFTYEKTYGYDLRFARRERARIPPAIGITFPCQDECTRRGSRCRGFVLEYGPTQHCFLLEDLAGDNRQSLTKINNVAYFEKICLREKHCGKLWTFDRVIGYTFEDKPEKEAQNVELRADCEDLCLAEKSFSCRSATFDYTNKICKMFSETRRSKPSVFKPTKNDVDYLENQCNKESTTCQYKDYTDTFFTFIDRVSHAYSLAECQNQCDNERFFICRSLNYESYSKDCALSSNDLTSVESSSNALHLRRYSLYSEKGNCEQVSVHCSQQEMMLTLNFDTPFIGRVYAKGNPSQCFVVGTGQNRLQFAISLGSRCGTKQEGLKNFANEVVIQQHAIIMTENDRTIKVMCSFSAIDQIVTLSSPNKAKPGIDVTSLFNPKSRVEHSVTSVVTNTAPPPNVIMRILDRSEQDAQIVSLGDELTMKIELVDPSSSAFVLSAQNLYARGSNGESLYLIDNHGCPTDTSIFPGLHLDRRDQKSLRGTFKAFRFPSNGVVNFEVQIRFCPDKCEQPKCANILEPYGRTKRQSDELTKLSEAHDVSRDQRSEDLIKKLSKQRDIVYSKDDDYPFEAPIYPYLNDIDITTVASQVPIPIEKNSTLSFETTPSYYSQWPMSLTRPYQPSNSYSYNQINPMHYKAYNSNYDVNSRYDNNHYIPNYSTYHYGYNSNPNFYYHPQTNSYYNNSMSNYPYPYHQSYYNHNPHFYQDSTYAKGRPTDSSLKDHQVKYHQPTSWEKFSTSTVNPRELSNKSKKKFRPPRPLPRPKGMQVLPKIVAGSKDSIEPQKVPLSLAIVVGDKDKNQQQHDKQTWNLETKARSSKIAGVEMSSLSCNTGPAILYTAIIITLAYFVVIVCGYFYYKNYMRYTGHTKLFASTPSISTENITNGVNRNPRPSNSNVFYATPLPSNDRVCHSPNRTNNHHDFRSLFNAAS